MISPAQALHIGIVALVLVVILGAGKRFGFIRRPSLADVGLWLMLLGAYFFPLGAIEAYDWTRIGWGLSSAMNSVFWYAVTTAAIVAGYVIVKCTTRRIS